MASYIQEKRPALGLNPMPSHQICFTKNSFSIHKKGFNIDWYVLGCFLSFEGSNSTLVFQITAKRISAGDAVVVDLYVASFMVRKVTFIEANSVLYYMT